MGEISIQSYYAQVGPMTDPRDQAGLLEGLPTEISALVQVLQGLAVHIFWAERYGLQLSEERKEEVNLRHVSQKLARIWQLDPRPLSAARPYEKRLVSNCRDFSTLLAGILRTQGVPARARCGFGVYFMPGHFEDHWMCEYWHAGEGRWVQVDAQLDELQRRVLGITFDPLDMPPGMFVLGGQAWQMCRRGEADPESFGIFQWHGWDFVRGNLFREVLTLNKIELLPWDFWGMMQKPVAECSPEEMALFDRAAEITLRVNECFPEPLEFYRQQPGLHAPEDWQTPGEAQ